MPDLEQMHGSSDKEAGAVCAGLLHGAATTPSAARLAFLEMKQLFLRAVDGLDHPKAAWLRREVLAAEDPAPLWMLRRPLLATLHGDERESARGLRAELYRCLDAIAR